VIRCLNMYRRALDRNLCRGFECVLIASVTMDVRVVFLFPIDVLALETKVFCYCRADTTYIYLTSSCQ